MAKSIKGSDRKALREALIAAYQSYSELRQMALDQLDFDINHRTDSRAGLVVAASELIEAMDEREGRRGLVRLVEAARAERLANPALREFELNFMNTADPFGDIHPTDELGAEVATRRGFERVIVSAAGFPEFYDVMATLGPAEYRVCFVSYQLPNGEKVYGTGFLIAHDLVMTNHHVVSQALQYHLNGSSMEVVFGWRSKESSVVRYGLVQTGWLAAKDKALDYAILRVDGQPGGDPVSVNGSVERGFFKLVSEVPETDEPLIIVQHPYDRLDGEPATLRLTIGFVRPHETGQSSQVIRHSANTSAGSSGSPVFTGRGDLIALHNWGGAKHNEAIRMGDIKRHLESTGFAKLLN